MKKTCLLFLICIMTACSASQKSMMYSDQKIKDVTIGMTKEQVIAIMGEGYEVIGSNEDTITLGYKTLDYGIYKLVFANDKLTGWNKEWFKNYYQDKPTRQ